MMTIIFYRFRIFFLCCLFMISTGCAIIYEQDIQQGNVLNDEMLDNLEKGMSKTEVKYHIGSPLIEDPFHANRWDYYYAFQEGGDQTRDHRVITLLFDEQDRLADIAGSVQTTDQPVRDVSLPDEGNLNTIISDIDQQENKGFWQSFKGKMLR